MDSEIPDINQVGKRVFYNPSPLYSYEELVQWSLGSNTYRAFHKIDKSHDEGAKYYFEKTFFENKSDIIHRIKKIESYEGLDSLEDNLCRQLVRVMKNNIVNSQLNSFNKLRKPVDIFIEHIVSMCDEFDSTTRERVVPVLALPLDSQVFKSKIVFNDEEADRLKIRRGFGFKDISSRSQYMEIQEFLNKKANRIGLESRIFFDLVWNERYKSNGGNLLKTNP